MKRIYFKHSRVFKLLAACLTALLVILVVTRVVWSPEEESENGAAPLNPQRHEGMSKIFSISSATFRGVGKVGNFEPPSYLKLSSSRGPGQNGKSFILPSQMSAEEEKLKNVYGFNQLVSDHISLNRTIPDLREEECRYWDYPDDLPSASVVLVFHNEGWSTLLRTMHSVINRSPPQFLKEIVLVDDKSELEHLHEGLDEEVKKPFYKGKVVVIRNKEREGLIRSRNNGAVASTAEVVIFLDAHCEVGYNWLPPLLAPIKDDRKTLSVPVIDGIQWSDFSVNPVYSPGSHFRGLFEWGMLYKEGDVPEKENARHKFNSEPYYSPTHAGGLFAISREWFKELGWYDPGLWVWGGENFELSFKVWMCGGNSVWVPCSRVAHVYRGHSCSSCHSGSLGLKFQGQPTTLRNYKRVIETWFDPDFKEYFYTREPFARFVDMGDISDQVAIKERLNCKSFSWFMNEVAFDVLEKYPRLPPNKYWGEFINQGQNLCLDSRGRNPPEKLTASGCHHGGGNQLLRLNTAGQLTVGEWCIDVENQHSVIFTLHHCTKGSVDGPWQYDESSQQLRHQTKKKCMTLQSEQPKLAECNNADTNQGWKLKTLKPFWSH